MILTFEEAVKLPMYYATAYRQDDGRRTNVYFSEKTEADSYAAYLMEMNRTQGTNYKLCIPCNRRCSECGICFKQ